MPFQLDFSQPAPRVQSLAEAQLLIEVLWALAGKVEGLEGQVATLHEQVRLNSNNSSKPPSSDGPGAAGKRPKPKRGKPRGGQPGHEGHGRVQRPPEQVDQVIECRPAAERCGCGHGLPAARLVARHQVVELPPLHPLVTEYALYQAECRHCGQRHRGELPPGVPDSQVGPCLSAEIGLLAGRYHLSHRLIQDFLADRYALELSLGTISMTQARLVEALAEAAGSVQQAVQQAAVVHADETSRTYRGERRWLWVAVTAARVAFRTTATRSQAAAKVLLGETFTGVLGS